MLFYNFLNAIECLRASHIFFNYYQATSDYKEKLKDFNNKAGIILPSLFGIMVLIFSCLFKDLMALFVNIIIDIGMIIGFFTNFILYHGSYSHLRVTEGIIDIISLLISLFLIGCITKNCSNSLF